MNPTPPPTPPTIPPVPETPVQPEVIAPPPVDAGGSSPEGSKKIMVVVGVLIVLIVVAGGLIYLRNQKQVSVTAPPQTVNAFDDLKKDAEAADVGSDTDMTEVDTDLNSL